MANPQLENGYVKIANDIFDALSRIRISGEARQVLDVIIRKTYGYNKKEDAISLSQFCLATGMRRGDVIRGAKKLMDMNIISKKANDIANVYRINKDFDTWKPLAKKLRGVAKKQISISKIANNDKQKSYIQKTVSKDNTTKDILQSKTIAPVVPKKREIQNPNTPITNWSEYLNQMDESNNRSVNIIAHYFRSKGLYFETRGKASSAIKRHLRAAQQLSPFSDEEIMTATIEAQKQYPELWTVESLIKILTR